MKLESFLTELLLLTTLTVVMDIVIKTTSTHIFAHVMAAVRFGETLAPKKLLFYTCRSPLSPFPALALFSPTIHHSFTILIALTGILYNCVVYNRFMVVNVFVI